MSKNEILEIMYEYALENGLCRNKKAFAIFIGISPTNYSKVFADTTERYCSLNVLIKANNALGNVFSSSWLVNGTGEMYAQSTEATDTTPLPSATVTENSSATDSSRVRELEYVIETQKKLIDMLERENEALKKENYYASVRVKNA